MFVCFACSFVFFCFVVDLFCFPYKLVFVGLFFSKVCYEEGKYEFIHSYCIGKHSNEI